MTKEQLRAATNLSLKVCEQIVQEACSVVPHSVDAVAYPLGPTNKLMEIVIGLTPTARLPDHRKDTCFHDNSTPWKNGWVVSMCSSDGRLLLREKINRIGESEIAATIPIEDTQKKLFVHLQHAFYVSLDRIAEVTIQRAQFAKIGEDVWAAAAESTAPEQTSHCCSDLHPSGLKASTTNQIIQNMGVKRTYSVSRAPNESPIPAYGSTKRSVQQPLEAAFARAAKIRRESSDDKLNPKFDTSKSAVKPSNQANMPQGAQHVLPSALEPASWADLLM